MKIHLLGTYLLACVNGERGLEEEKSENNFITNQVVSMGT